MQQLYLTGAEASSMAVHLFRALRIQPVGYVTLPFSTAGRCAGQLLHMLCEPGAPLRNDVPCRIALYQGRSVVVPQVMNELAAPSLRLCLSTHVPMVLDDLDTALLACKDFSAAVAACLHSQHLVVAVVRDDARLQVQHMTPPQEQLWMDTAAPNALEQLIAEVSPRL